MENITTKQELTQAILRFQAIGVEIAALHKESKELRQRIASGCEELKLSPFGRITGDSIAKFLVGNLQITVKASSEDRDYAILIDNLEQILD